VAATKEKIPYNFSGIRKHKEHKVHAQEVHI